MFPEMWRDQEPSPAPPAPLPAAPGITCPAAEERWPVPANPVLLEATAAQACLWQVCVAPACDGNAARCHDELIKDL